MRGRFLPHERACFAIEMTGADVVQGAARSIDRKIHVNPLSPMNQGSSFTGCAFQVIATTESS